MEACVIICRTAKPRARKGKILFINAVGEVTRERAQSFLTDEHIKRIVKSYEKFKDEPGFTCVATLEDIRAKDGNLSLPLYIRPGNGDTTNIYPSNNGNELRQAIAAWLESSRVLHLSLDDFLSNKKINPLG